VVISLVAWVLQTWFEAHKVTGQSNLIDMLFYNAHLKKLPESITDRRIRNVKLDALAP